VKEEKSVKSIVNAKMVHVPATLSLIVGLIVAILVSRVASAETYYVSPNGNNDDSGAEDAPFRTIEHGISVLQAGDVLQIMGGTYVESFTWWNGGGTSWSDAVTVEAATGEEVIWEVPAQRRVAIDILDVHYVTIRGIIFDGTNGANRMVQLGYTTTPVSGSEMLVSLSCVSNDQNQCAHHIRFEGNEFRQAAYVATQSSPHTDVLEFVNNHIHHIGKVANSPGFYMGSPNCLFDGNHFHDIGGDAIGLWNEDGSTVHNGIIRNNLIVRAGWFWAGEGTHENSNSPLELNSPNLRAPAIFVSRGGGTKVYNNIIVDSPGGIGAGHDLWDCLIANNTIYGNTASGIGDPQYNAGILLDDIGGGSRNCTVQNNIVYQPGVDFPQPIVNLGVDNTLSNNLTTDPLFVDPSSHDFRLQEGSPAIDAGTEVDEVTEDYDGVSRPQGDAYDIGAFEF
jgi:hypothetical protein